MVTHQSANCFCIIIHVHQLSYRNCPVRIKHSVWELYGSYAIFNLQLCVGERERERGRGRGEGESPRERGGEWNACSEVSVCGRTTWKEIENTSTCHTHSYMCRDTAKLK